MPDDEDVDLLCPICLDIICQPWTLYCGHNFDRECLVTFAFQQHQTNELSCPVCRSSIEREILGKLRINHTLDRCCRDRSPAAYQAKLQRSLGTEDLQAKIDQLQIISSGKSVSSPRMSMTWEALSPGSFLVLFVLLTGMLFHFVPVVGIVVELTHVVVESLNAIELVFVPDGTFTQVLQLLSLL